MKLLKIGSSASCDIVFNSEFVSGVHAELLLADDGKMFLEDKNSLNGTFVGNKRLTPNEEVRVQRGDLVRFGDTELNWNKVPVNYGPKNGETWYNIGTSQKVDIPVSSPFVSRFHAILMQKDKKFFIMDNGSKNGTLVDGKKIPVNKFVPIKRGQSVICGDSDITEQIATYMPNKTAWIKPLLIGLAACAAVVGLFFGIWALIGKGGWTKKYVPAVVYVQASYHYVAYLEDTPVPKTLWDGELPDYTAPRSYSATAFFVDRKGVMATNRHVAVPWEYEDEEIRTQLLNDANATRKRFLPVTECNNMDDVNNLNASPLGRLIVAQWMESGDRSRANLNAMIDRMLQAKITLKGVMDYISVGYPDRYYTHLDELDRCFVLGESGTDDKDIALLQLNVKQTPENIKYVFDIDTKVYEGVLDPLAEKLVVIGYPRGTDHALIENTHSLQPTVRETMVGMKPERYSFEYQGESIGGASGSPIFNPKNGMLYGVNWGKWTAGATFGRACKAQFLKELYNEYKDVL